MKLLSSLSLALLGMGSSSAFLLPKLPTAARVTSRSQTAVKMSAAVEWKGSTLTDTRLAEEAASIFLEPPFIMKPTSGGVNNVCLRVATEAEPEKEYILRVYNNGGNTARVEWEHEILRQLNKYQGEMYFKVGKGGSE